MVTIAKSGYMKRYSKSILSGGWQTVWVILYSDSNLVLYKRQGDNEIKGKVNMKEVSKRFAYGQFTEGMPDRPNCPSGYSYSQMLAIPTKNNSKAKIYWFLCSSESDLHEWMTAICKTLPPPPAHKHSQAQPVQSQIQPVAASTVSSAPPPYSAGPPQPQPGGLGFDGLAGGGYPPAPMQGAPAPYPTQAPPAQPYPTQPNPYPVQPGYQPYPQQAYPAAGYPQQPYQQPGYQQPYVQPGGYAYQPGYQQPQYVRQPNQVVYVQKSPSKSGLGGIGGSNTAKIAAGVIGGAALGYGASRMMGGFGGPFGFGFGRHGSWSSLSSFGSCGSFGSFGSFD